LKRRDTLCNGTIGLNFEGLMASISSQVNSPISHSIQPLQQMQVAAHDLYQSQARRMRKI